MAINKMDMRGMEMEMSSDPVFRTADTKLAHAFWYIMAGLMVFILLLRAIEAFQRWSRLRLSRTRSVEYSTKPQNAIEQAFATCTAIGREISYPQLRFLGAFSWLSPPSLGRIILLLGYWAMMTYMLTTKAIVSDLYYYERIGFRAAWISLTQVPLVYLLSSKASIVGYLVGSSYERLNWLHRWTARTLLVTVTFHGGFFIWEWYLADFIATELSMMGMVKWGLGAWAILVWTFFTSLSPLRRIAYEFFVLQHIAGAVVFLWVIWVHVPKYAHYFVWFAIAAASFDWIFRSFWWIFTNLGLNRFGFQANIQTNGDEITIITLADIPVSWKPGQHFRLWIPQLGHFESHPLTIATPPKLPDGSKNCEIQFSIRSQSGFTRRINRYAKNMEDRGNSVFVKAFVAGPYGVAVDWKAYETVVLISASTGASFTLPVLESILNDKENGCVRRIKYLLVAQRRIHIVFYTKRLLEALARASAARIELGVEVAITSDENERGEMILDPGVVETSKFTEQDFELDDDSSIDETKSEGSQAPDYISVHSRSSSEASVGFCSGNSTQRLGYAIVTAGDVERIIPGQITYSQGRPNLAEFIREAVEITGGETVVAVCGGKSLVASVRNCIAALSNDRAVHKGTGAQGICLYTEEYCF